MTTPTPVFERPPFAHAHDPEVLAELLAAASSSLEADGATLHLAVGSGRPPAFIAHLGSWKDLASSAFVLADGGPTASAFDTGQVVRVPRANSPATVDVPPLSGAGGIGGIVALPLTDESGWVFGVLTLWYGDPGRPAGLELGPLAPWLRLVGRLVANDLRHRPGTEARLQDGEERYRTLLASVDLGFCIIEIIPDETAKPVDYRFLEVNPTFELHTGLTGAVGRTAKELVPDLEPSWVERYAQVAETGQPITFEQGSVAMGRAFEVEAVRVGRPAERTVALLLRDVTERNRTAAALRASEERKAFLLALNDALRQLADPVMVQHEAARRLGRYLGASRVGYAEDQGDGETVVVTRTYTDWVAGIEGRYRYADYGPGLIGELTAGRTVVRPDIANDPLLTDDEQQAHVELDLASTIEVPLVKEGGLAAIFFVHQDVPRAWTPDEVSLSEEVAERAWAAVERARAERQLRQAIERYERQVRLFDAVASATPDFVYLFDLDGRFRYANRRLLDAWGLTPADVIGRTFGELGYEPWLQARHRREIAEIVDTRRPVRGEVPFRFQRTGVAGTYEYILAPVVGPDGDVELIAGTTRDVTDRARAEAERRYRSEQLRMLLDSAPIGIYLVDADFRIAQVNPVALPVFGDEADPVGRNFEEVIRGLWPTDAADEIVRVLRHTLTTGEPHHVPEYVEVRADRGITEYYDWRIDRITLPDGRFGVVVYFIDISEQVRTRTAIAASEERYRSLFESMDEGFCILELLVDGDGRALDARYVEVNPAFERQTRLRDVIGRTVREVTPEIQDHWFEVYGAVARTGTPTRFIDHARGMGRWFEVNAFRVGEPGENRVAVLFSDVTARKDWERSLSDAQARLRSALDAGSVGTWAWEVRTDIMTADERTAALFEIGPAMAAAGMPRPRFVAAIHPDDRDGHEPGMRQAAERGGRYQAEYRIVAADGRIRWLQARGLAFRDEDGRPDRIVGAVVDITPLKEGEAELLEREDRLRTALNVKDEFLGLVSHELRTPMTVILGMSRLLKGDGGDPTRLRDLAVDIAESADSLNELVEGMLLLARLDKDEADQFREPVLLHRVAGDVLVRARRRDHAPHFELRVRDRDAIVEVQRTWLERVIENLVGNAAKYGGPGASVTVIVDRLDGMARMRVLDNGPGISEEDADRLFEPFYRSADVRGRAPGAGLGLAVAQRIVSLLGGRIWGLQRPGGGAEFGFELPIHDGVE